MVFRNRDAAITQLLSMQGLLEDAFVKPFSPNRWVKHVAGEEVDEVHNNQCGSGKVRQCRDNRSALLFLQAMFDCSSREAPFPLTGRDFNMPSDQPHDHAESHASVLMRNLQRCFPNGRKLGSHHIYKFLVTRSKNISP